MFLDKIYSIYHQSSKNQNKLLEPVAKDLGIEIVKIGRVMRLRWAACTLQAATAIWCAYPAYICMFLIFILIWQRIS